MADGFWYRADLQSERLHFGPSTILRHSDTCARRAREEVRKYFRQKPITSEETLILRKTTYASSRRRAERSEAEEIRGFRPRERAQRKV